MTRRNQIQRIEADKLSILAIAAMRSRILSSLISREGIGDGVGVPGAAMRGSKARTYGWRSWPTYTCNCIIRVTNGHCISRRKTEYSQGLNANNGYVSQELANPTTGVGRNSDTW